MQAPPSPPSHDLPTLDTAQLEALRPAPSGAVALSAASVVLLLVAWLLIYFLIYLPRGTIG
jgi:hypothetical protein